MNMRVVTSGRTTARDQAAALLRERSETTLLAIDRTETDVRSLFARADAVYSDVDGTVVPEGLSVMDPSYVAALERMTAHGVQWTLVTGKPYEEISGLVASLPADLPIHIIYEKGAYVLERSAGGATTKQYLLTSAEQEQAVATLRQYFEEQKATIEQRYVDAYGRPLVAFGWAGAGTHQSVVSIDILRANLPADYLSRRGSAREELKVHDPELVRDVAADIATWAHEAQPTWRVVDLGNGNIEIAPQAIEKDAAIRKQATFQQARQVLLLGDSANDRAMLALRDGVRVVTGLVLHREATLDLVPSVDVVTFGMANAAPFLALLER